MIKYILKYKYATHFKTERLLHEVYGCRYCSNHDSNRLMKMENFSFYILLVHTEWQCTIVISFKNKQQLSPNIIIALPSIKTDNIFRQCTSEYELITTCIPYCATTPTHLQVTQFIITTKTSKHPKTVLNHLLVSICYFPDKLISKPPKSLLLQFQNINTLHILRPNP